MALLVCQRGSGLGLAFYVSHAQRQANTADLLFACSTLRLANCSAPALIAFIVVVVVNYNQVLYDLRYPPLYTPLTYIL